MLRVRGQHSRRVRGAGVFHTNFDGTGKRHHAKPDQQGLAEHSDVGKPFIPQTTYYFRAGGLNRNNVPNFSPAFLSTPTANVARARWIPWQCAGSLQHHVDLGRRWRGFLQPLCRQLAIDGHFQRDRDDVLYGNQPFHQHRLRSCGKAAVDGGVQGALSNSATTYKCRGRSRTAVVQQ